ncbi:MAG TPA: hypothetical protein VNX68_12080 [Nitrosopumilaceae archaeon]|jgi:hypothetical protein|nr:hypothetical protein [Nitrosopumilaceae archaeon]
MVDVSKIKLDRIIQRYTPTGWLISSFSQIKPGDIFMLFNVNEATLWQIWQATAPAVSIPLTDGYYTWQISCVPIGEIKPQNLFMLGVKSND